MRTRITATKRVQVDMPEPVWTVLSTLAEAKGTSVAEEIRQALDGHLQQATHPSVAKLVAVRHLAAVLDAGTDGGDGAA